MLSRLNVSLALVTVVLGVAGVAALTGRSTADPRPEAAPPVVQAAAKVTPTALPPGHPAIGAGGSAHGRVLPPPKEPPAIAWRAPSEWIREANPSVMRAATYRVPRVPGDQEDADVSVTRAGGTTDANIERWLGQFEARGKESRTEKEVRGLKVTIVEVSGTFLGGTMTSGTSEPRPNWTLLGAVIESAGAHYFVKATGPAATLRAARASFESLVDSVTPS